MATFNFRSLGSGSSGNSYLFETEEGFFLIDAGVGIRKIQKYLIESGVSLTKLKALFLTHDHSDHSRNAGCLQLSAQKKGIVLPVFTTEKVIQGIQANPTITKKPVHEWIHYIQKEQTIECCGCRLTAFEVPHDSNDNVGYLIEHQNRSICLITDVGEITNEIEKYIQKTTQLILESNYDDKMLDDGPYPEILKRRIRSGSGHLCNLKAAETIYNHRKQLEKVWLCHLSENNNTPEKAFEMVLNVFHGNGLKMSDFIDLQVLMRKTPSTVFHL